MRRRTFLPGRALRRGVPVGVCDSMCKPKTLRRNPLRSKRYSSGTPENLRVISHHRHQRRGGATRTRFVVCHGRCLPNLAGKLQPSRYSELVRAPMTVRWHSRTPPAGKRKCTQVGPEKRRARLNCGTEFSFPTLRCVLIIAEPKREPSIATFHEWLCRFLFREVP